MRVVFVLATWVLAFAGSVPAQTVTPTVTPTVILYRCTDASGKVSYSSAPYAAGSKQEIRSDAIRTRFFNAQEKERDSLRIEERSVNARLDNDCGGH